FDGAFENMGKAAKTLDMFSIPTRYPNGLGGELAPAEFYEKEDAEECLRSADLILKTVKALLGP
ncbi:MAG: HEPN domain-containing protein, partial [Candidatus Caldatribacteriaceae bacterium]